MFVNGVSVVLVGESESVIGMSVVWATQTEKSHIVISLPKNADSTESLLEVRKNIFDGNQEEIAAKYGGSKCRNRVYQ